MRPLSHDSQVCLGALRLHSECDVGGGWRTVYLDNARPAGWSANKFRRHLAVLAKHGLYRVVDAYAFGDVKMDGPGGPTT